jgi:hypothetical protein
LLSFVIFVKPLPRLLSLPLWKLFALIFDVHLWNSFRLQIKVCKCFSWHISLKFLSTSTSCFIPTFRFLKALKVFTSLKPREHLWFLHAWLFKRLLQLELIPLGQYLRNRYLLHLPNLLQFLLVFCLQVRCQLLFARKLSVSALRRIIRRKMVNIQQKMLVACAVRRLALWVCRSCDCCFFGSLEEMVFYLRL